MSRNEPCFCGSGIKIKKCHSDIEHDSAFANLVSIYKQVDAKIANEAGAIRCRKGCFSCCHEHFSVSPVEFYFIMYNIYKQHGMDKVNELTEKGYQYWLTFEQEHPVEAKRLVANLTGQDPSNSTTRTMMEGITDDFKRFSDTPCMFLDDETKACTIYDYRPLVCRTYGSGYTTKFEVPFVMCEHILDGLDYQNEMVDLTEFKDTEVALTAVLVEELDSLVIERNYPIFYFLKIQRGKIEVTLRKIEEYRKYSLSKVLGMKVKRIQ